MSCSKLSCLRTNPSHLYFLHHIIFTRTWLRYVYVSSLSQIRLSSVMFVRPTQGVETFCNISLPLCTLAILWPLCKILWESSQENLFVGDVKRQEGYSYLCHVRVSRLLMSFLSLCSQLRWHVPTPLHLSATGLENEMKGVNITSTCYEQ